MKKKIKSAVAKDSKKATLWSNSSVADRVNAVLVKFSDKTLRAVAKNPISMKKGEAEKKYKKSFSKDVLNKVMR